MKKLSPKFRKIFAQFFVDEFHDPASFLLPDQTTSLLCHGVCQGGNLIASCLCFQTVFVVKKPSYNSKNLLLTAK
jgi:hypothetical protein